MTVLEELPNVGPAIAADFVRLGIRTPRALAGRDPVCALRRAQPHHRHAPRSVRARHVHRRRAVHGRRAGTAVVEVHGGAQAHARAARGARGSPPPKKPAPRERRGEDLGAKIQAHPLAGLGPVSKRMLAGAGITSLETLRRLGAVEAYRRVRSHRSARVAQSAVGARRRADRPAVGGRRAQRPPLASAAARQSFLTETSRTSRFLPTRAGPALFHFVSGCFESHSSPSEFPCPTPSSISPTSSCNPAPPPSPLPGPPPCATTRAWA